MPVVKPWPADPSDVLVAVFRQIAETRMQGLPICNPALAVEAIGFRRRNDGHWAGVLITPWGINLLCLPGGEPGWPILSPTEKHWWAFPSGDYEFTVAEESSLGIYHLCSLFSPALEFPDQAQARLTALAIVHALFADAAVAPVPVTETPRASGRRAFLGLGR